MHTHLGSETLKNGERLEISVVEGPDAEWQPRIEPFLAHKGPGWNDHIRRALAEPLDSLQTRFYVGCIGEELVTQVMIVGSGGAGILGHVYTKPEHRRKGAYSRLMAYQTEDMPRCGFSNQVVQILNHLGVEYGARDILVDPRIRMVLSEWSEWPTIPQLFVDGKLVGGCDIVTEMYQDGELQELLD